VNIPPTPCFYYAGVQVLWCWYVADLETLRGLLPEGMEPASFVGSDGARVGAVNFSFMNAVAMYGAGQPGNPGGNGFNETELNVVAYAAARRKDVPPDLTFHDFLFGADQAKNLGVYRLHVACDSGVAVAAGRAMYYENKFLASYTYTSPTLNQPVPAQATSAAQWTITCFDGDTDKAPVIYQAKADLRTVTLLPANCSEIIDLSYDVTGKRVLGSRRNFLGMHQAAMLGAAGAGAVQVSVGPSTNPMRQHMEQLVVGRPAAAVQVFASPPVIAEAVPYYMDLI
jgi:hypothetical protein